MQALRDYDVFESWLAARDFLWDLEMVAPQVIWVNSSKLELLEKVLSDLDIFTERVSNDRAEQITVENKPVRGEFKIHIRSPNKDINREMIKRLKAQNLISHYRYGSNTDNIYHWKDDRWHQNFYLFAFKEDDEKQIEALIKDYYFIVVRDEG